MTDASEERLQGLARELYRLPPDRFVAERDRRATELKADGEPELAAAVKKLRKPTLPAWTADQVVLREPGAVERLWAAGDAVRAAMQGRGNESLREASGRLSDQLSALRERAAAFLGELGASGPPHLDGVERTLMLAAVDDQARSEVATGTLTRPLEPSGFETLAGLDPGGAGSTTRTGDTPPPPARRRQLQRERRRLEQQIEEVEERSHEARRRAESLRRRADAAEQDATERDRARTQARDRLREVLDELGQD